jgi:hypothetical protein
VTVKVLETFLEVIMWKPFKPFRRILNYVSSRPFNAYSVEVEGTGKNQLETVQEGMGDVLALSLCSLIRNP